MILLFRDEYEKIIERAKRSGKRRFLVAWNRGFGDVPLCVYGFAALIKERIKDAEVTIMTRPGLDEVFRLIKIVDDVITVPHWTREDNLKKGQPTQLDVEEELERLNLIGRFDVLIPNLRAGKWRTRQIGKIIPRLEWSEEYRKSDCFANAHNDKDREDKYVVSLHPDSETGHIYGYNKNWDMANWKELVKRLLSKDKDIHFILLGLKKQDEPFLSHPSIIDMRGRTDIRQLLSIITSSNMLIAPDSGILTLVYYLDANLPLDVISLWGPAKYGVLQLKVDSPNRLLNHFPLKGKGEDINSIKVEDVFNLVAERMTLWSLKC